MKFVRFTPRAGILLSAALVAFIALAGYLVLIQRATAHAQASAENTLTQTADTTTRTLAAWIDAQFDGLDALASNTILQNYFTKLASDQPHSPSAEGDYLHHQMTLTADRLGFAASIGTPSQTDQTQPATGGLALLRNDGRPILATVSMPAIPTPLANATVKRPGAPMLFDLPPAANGTPRVGFVIPIHALQSEPLPTNQVGSIVGVRLLDAPFFAMLSPAASAGTVKLSLLQNTNGTLRSITAGGGTTEGTLETDAHNAAAFAVSEPGTVAEKRDVNGTQIIATGRAIPHTPWTLLTQIDKSAIAPTSATPLAIVLLLLAACTPIVLYISHRRGHGRLEAAIIHEREKRMHTLHQLIAMLVSLVDARDPYAAQHSACTALLAGATARALNLDTRTIETTETAARLLNIGKMDIPAELLTRTDALNDSERLVIRSSLTTSADLLSGIAFDGPVAETIRQTAEHIDGSGPRALSGSSIVLSAQIVAAANALVGMLSPRSYRAAMSFAQAQQQLIDETGTRFSPAVVTAMLEYLDTQSGRVALTTLLPIAHPPQSAVA